jgi:hypothetical protein
MHTAKELFRFLLRLPQRFALKRKGIVCFRQTIKPPCYPRCPAQSVPIRRRHHKPCLSSFGQNMPWPANADNPYCRGFSSQAFPQFSRLCRFCPYPCTGGKGHIERHYVQNTPISEAH